MSILSWLPVRPHAMRALAIVTLGALGACTPHAADPPAATTPSDDARLFAQAFTAIHQLYIRPVSDRTLVVDGAAHLSALDPNFVARPGPGVGSTATLQLNYQGQKVGSYVLPGATDAKDSAKFLARVIGVARQVSPLLAAASDDVVDHAVFNGITGGLDRFSRYSPPALARELRDARDGYGGIGITLDSSNDEFLITAVTPRGPAERVGIRPGDRITAINGVATARHSRAWVIERLRGAVGSLIQVAVARAGGQIHDFRIDRARLVRPTTTVSHDGDILVFHIATFNETTTALVAAAVKQAMATPGGRLSGIVLDLRGDPGGLLGQAVSLDDLFIKSGPIIATLGRNPASHQYFAATGHAIARNLPIVVLINGGSASASEITAAALQDIGRAVVVGSASYGKGTVQTALPLVNGGELTITWARLIAPSGYLLQSHGVVPTVCTSDLANNPQALDIALQRAQAPASPGFRAASPRAAVDEAGWEELRRACPADPASPAVDLAVAEKLLNDPALYATALRALPPATALVRSIPGAPSARSLTRPRAALSSELR
ncbi:MAG TPA: S41 family peptidase [Stellaceae bacterium]|nr:S41 family peptidase [Stellaceae bacterium]